MNKRIYTSKWTYIKDGSYWELPLNISDMKSKWYHKLWCRIVVCWSVIFQNNKPMVIFIRSTHPEVKKYKSLALKLVMKK